MSSRTKKKIHVALAVALVASALLTAAPMHAEGLDDLAWMVGAWRGPALGGTLEERWAPRDGNTMAALVRSTAADKTNMVEIIVIEETADGLQLRLRQHEPDLTPRTEGPLLYTLESMGERTVTWAATDETNTLAKLTYSSSSPEAFQVKIGLRAGNEIAIDLAKVD